VKAYAVWRFNTALGTVYADAEFDGIGVIDALEEENLSYLIQTLLGRGLLVAFQQ